MVGSTSAFGQEEIQQAIVGLPKRQREALELLERERLSYEEIAASLGTSYGSVAQLISRARINLYDELRGTPLASVAAPSPECERSLPLIAAREDGQLDNPSDGDAVWLDAHLADCDRCRPAVEQMAEAAAYYRGWGTPADVATPRAPAPGDTRRRRRTTLLVVTSLAVVLLAGLAAAFVGDGGAPAPADSVTAPGTSGGEAVSQAKVAGRKGAAKKKPKPAAREAKTAAGQAAAGATAAETAAPTTVVDPGPPAAGGGAPSKHTSGPNRSSGKTAVNPPKQVSIPKPSSKSKPAPTSQVSQPAPEPSPIPPSPEASPPAEETPDKPGRSGEAPGKPAERPPR